MQRETHLLNEIHAVRFTGDTPKYALVVSHGIGAHGGIYDIFCEQHAARGADIWSYDAPGHGRSTTNRPRGQWTMEEWAQASRDWAAHVKQETGLPVFTLGSSLGVAAAISAINSNDVTGAICMGSPAVPGAPMFKALREAWRNDAVKQVLGQLGRAARLDIKTFFNFDEDYGYAGASEQKQLDPWNTWSYDLESWASFFQYDPEQPPEANTKPVLYTAGEKDPSFPPDVIKLAASAIGGPVTLKVFEDAGHQLMLFETTRFSDAVHDFCLSTLRDEDA
ncbi:Lysophospholipase; Monoglyceride lipase; putative [Candidatus Phaeomarinobacter ectocarpi]|uniref:Lysophospholipase Monoglyceride lipase putative n=1 Tax=Candidatus Phaeomarinibacter ectocarpi TaxID=1458461 RepID=X5M9H6_9HYPH|nr:alpha/beta fold hydrolase [Candidatus Phaeomarinobacter ectocarpi]CDO60193.1 Lysophospholipase; Monoglyceride lipase; putative [Candidatus Phaeomarinobacter ectocarpi]